MPIPIALWKAISALRAMAVKGPVTANRVEQICPSGCINLHLPLAPDTVPRSQILGRVCNTSVDCIKSHTESSRARREFLRRIRVCNLDPTLVESGPPVFGRRSR